MIDKAEIAGVVEDLEWLNRCTCTLGRTVNDFFVEAGHNIAADVLLASRLCPVRRQEVIWAYTIGGGIRHGHFGGMSPGERSRMSLEQALEFIESDTAAARLEVAACQVAAAA